MSVLSAGSWSPLAKVSCLVLGSVLAVGSAADAFRHVLPRVAPQLAMRLIPGEHSVAVRIADQTLGLAKPGELSDSELDKIDAAARDSIADNSLDVRAFRVLGTSQAFRGNGDTALAMMRHSDRLSRREVGVQLWLLEDAAQSGDLAGAVRHFHRLLTTKPTSRAALFPVLAAAIEDVQVRGALQPYLAARPPWETAFYDYALARMKDPRPLAKLMAAQRQLPPQPGQSYQQAMLLALTAKGDYAAAQWFMRAMPDGDKEFVAGQVRDRSFRATGKHQPFDWTLVTDFSAAAEPIADARSGLAVRVDPNWTGLLARQLLMLRPGRYRLHVEQRTSEAPEAVLAGWKLECADSRRPLASIKTPKPPKPVRSQVEFSVPTGCPAQWLSYTVDRSAERGELHTATTTLRVTPAGTQKDR